MNKIHNMDNLIGMDQLILDGVNVNLIIADPPYVISKESQFHTMKDRKNPRTGTTFGDWDEEFDNRPWIEKSFEVLKPGGSMIVFNDFKKISDVIQIATECGIIRICGFDYKDSLIWHKSNPMPRNRDRRYVPAMEIMVWLVKPKAKWTFNRQDEKYETGLFNYPSESGGGFKRIHPTQKPVKLVKQLILIHSNEGDTVLDPFMGSGTTAVAAKESNRNYIGYEINTVYYEKSIERVGTTTQQKLF